MAELLSVGEFARLTHLTVRTLHHYHEAGVLEPASVDPATGYRYYRPEQSAHAQLARRLRAVQMPLPQIRDVLAAPDEERRDAGIAAHLDRLRRELADTAAAVTSLQGLLTRPSTDVEISYRDLPDQPCMLSRVDIDRAGLLAWCAQAYPRLYGTAAQLGLRPTGPGGGLYRTEWFGTGAGQVTAFVPVHATGGAAWADTGEVRAGLLPAQRLAVALHAGPFDDLDRTYAALGRHVLARGLGAAGPIREHYLISPADTDDPGGLLTEVCWPVTDITVTDTTGTTPRSPR